MTSNPTMIAERYRLTRLVKQGGMGVVYEAFDTERGVPCAVKLLSAPELHQNPEVLRRFCREARACSALVSEHIVTVLDSGVDSATATPYLVMELLQGEDLEKLLERLGPLDPWVAVKLALQVAKGLATAHAAFVLHRDIKPANVFLSVRDSEEIVATILDFGVAKVRVESSLDVSGALTQTGSLLGTPLYMSPEQACGASDVDARTDVWSLGAVLFEMLTGSVPFGNPGNFGALMVALLTEDLPLVQDRAPWVPPEIAELTHRALSRTLSHRFADAGELRDALLALMPSDTRLYKNELAPISSDRRSRSARRIQHLNAELVRAPRSTPRAPRPRRLARTLAVIAAASSLGGAVALATAASSRARETPASSAAVLRTSEAPTNTHTASSKSEAPLVTPVAHAPTADTPLAQPAPAVARGGSVALRGSTQSGLRELVSNEKKPSSPPAIAPEPPTQTAKVPAPLPSSGLTKDLGEFE